MARIKYVGGLPATSWRGVTFHHGLWTAPGALSDDELATLAANPTFVVDLADDGPLDTPPSPPASAPPGPVAASGVDPNGEGDSEGDLDPDGTYDGSADGSARTVPPASLSI